MRPGTFMRAPRSLALVTFVIAGAISAMPLAAGASSASASTSRGAAPSAVTWHKLKLINGWASQQSSNKSGDPAWAMQRGIVYLAGSLQQLSGTTHEFAVLPRAARPAKIVIIPTDVSDGFRGHIEVLPSGALLAASAPQSGARGFTSLAALSFPAAGTPTRHLALRNGWQPGPSAWKTGDPASSLIHGIVYLSGVMRDPHGTNSRFATLPPGSRPAHVLYITVYTDHDTTGTLRIEPSGAMFVVGGNAAKYTSLNGVSFPAGPVVSHDLTLIDGWQSAQPAYNTGDPAYSIVNGVVHLSGSLLAPSVTGSFIALLPAKARPAHNMWIQTYTFDGSVGYVIIYSDGYVAGGSYPNYQKFTSLASISYPIGS